MEKQSNEQKERAKTVFLFTSNLYALCVPVPAALETKNPISLTFW